MEKLMITRMKTLGILRAAFAAALGLPFLLTTSAFAQAPEATTERVTVTGSYIPTAEEEIGRASCRERVLVTV